MSVKITDLVEQTAIDRIKELDSELKGLVSTYTETAKELAKGIDINVKIVGDLDKLETLLVERSKEAATVNGHLNQVVTEQNQIIANTSNTLSRHLMEQERVNKSQREAYTDTEKFKALMERVNGSYEQRVQRLVQLEKEIKDAKTRESELSKEFEKGTIDQKHYTEIMTELRIGTRALMQEKADLTTHLKNEEREMQSVEGSYRNQSQRLELMKKAYKDLTDEERNSPLGREMEAAIQNLDAHLKDVAADMGEFQRNVGNYAIAGQKGVATTESVVAAMNQEARTTQDLIDQTRILEEAKVMLDKSDGNYQKTLAALNSKIDENKRKLSDVSDILHKDATSVAEAESQNKRLKEALKQVDLSSDGAQKRIKELNDKIAKNTKLIKQNTPALQDQVQALNRQSRVNEGLAENMLNLTGLNSKFGTSLRGLETGGNVFSGMKIKVAAFGKTLMGLLTNPYVLTFLGIVGVGAGIKWWYEYNKGLIEASRLTANFTGLSGKAADKITSDIQAIADTLKKTFPETITAANTLVMQFGLTWEDAIKLMEDGYVAGADMSGNMLNNINQFAPALRDAGVSADEFMSILAETRNGIFNERGIQDIVKGGTRLRDMTDKMAESLDAVGISSKKMKEDLKNGTITMMDAVQQVAAKLRELPENSQEAGAIMKEVFGRTAAEGGTLLIQSIADINLNLEEAKNRMGSLGEVNQELIDSQKELTESLAAVFKMSGTSFEEMTTKAKVLVNQGLLYLLKVGVDVVNWFIDMYNHSIIVRAGVFSLILPFKQLVPVCTAAVRIVVQNFKQMGTALMGVIKILGSFWEALEKAVTEGDFDGFAIAAKTAGKVISESFSTIVTDNVDIFTDLGKEAYKNFTDGWESVVSKEKIANISYKLPDTDNKTNNGISNDNSNNNKNNDDSQSDNNTPGNGLSKRLESLQDELKKIQELENTKLELMEEGHEKELAQIRAKYKRKLDEIKGNGETEIALRVAIAEQCQKEIEACEEKYQRELSKINLENRLAAVEEGSKEELDLKLAQLEANRNAELEAAKKTGADVDLINAKFNKQRLEMEQDYTAKQAEEIMNRYAVEEMTREQAYSKAVNALKERYAKELALAGGNKEKQEKLKKDLEDNLSKLQEDYSLNTAQSSIDMINEVLNLENMSAKDRLKWEQELAKAQMDLDNQVADAHTKSVEKQMEDDDKLREKRKANLSQWLQIASDSISNISELVNTLFDGQIQKIEEEQEANQEAGDQEQERISQLVEKKVITEEEGEARKRAAEAQTAKKNEELEKKKAALLRKQAIFQKATDLAQAGIATALAVTQALPNLVLAAIAGAMGAINIATIAATPIPKYARGTDYHPGGPAIVGDGGRPEVISFNGSAWLTPDKPTLLDIPTGAAVYPDVIDYVENPLAKMVIVPDSTPKVKPYDDSGVRSLLREFINAVKAQTKQHHRDMMDAKYEEYKKRI